MSKLEKLRQRMVAIPADFTWDELILLLGSVGFEEKSKKGGSYRTFFREDGRKLFLHKPHPGSIVKKYCLRNIVTKLQEFGLLDSEE
ncbi:addiction module toxin, HicA family [Burkholderia pseudomallei]|uniref:type II toxin-antitoxin system HicA family toxin n=1 Tax=Burkholderia TaxID=32008 RepID=UPI0009ECA162|nr:MULTISPECIES: type II toxin-antitoxin system HicA family toxin [Burkholderia]MWJ56937.1 addiction module toxin, HicA family [Burkholderia pseudomallei]